MKRVICLVFTDVEFFVKYVKAVKQQMTSTTTTTMTTTTSAAATTITTTTTAATAAELRLFVKQIFQRLKKISVIEK